MTENKFTKTVNKLCEGDYVLIHLNTNFLARQQERKLKEYKEAMTAPKRRKGPVESMPLVIPASYTIPIPGSVVGKIGEILMSLIYLVDAWEDGSKEPVKKAYEYREVRSISSITKDQYLLVVDANKVKAALCK